ncbi:MAG: hypothetical protein GY861_07410 [bacterium]|nr:hypothetical protein [bacterium]
MKKRGQVTVFIIIGIVLLFIVGFLIWMARTPPLDDPGNMKQEIQPINNYITSYLEEVTEEGIVLMGQQAGYIYSDQEGLVHLDNDYEGRAYLIYNGKKVQYLIDSPSEPFIKFIQDTEGTTLNEVPPPSPDYPWKFFPLQSELVPDTIFKSNTGIFGDAMDITPLKKIPGSGAKKSMEDQLEFYLRNRMFGNNDKVKSEFSNRGFDIETPEKTEIEVTVTISKDDVTVQLLYPMEITKRSTGDKIEVEDFSARSDAKVKEVYDKAVAAIKTDTTDISHDIQDSDWVVDKIEDVFVNDDVIVVEDDEKSFTFYFARKNRAPALVYVTPKTIDKKVPFGTCEDTDTGETIFCCTHPPSFDIFVEDVEGKIGTLSAYDPDEDIPHDFENFEYDLPINLPYAPTVSTQIEILVGDGELEDYQDVDFTINVLCE